jgi:translation initiation factor 2 gamma subunit (eIF-2gamma)
MVAEIEQVPDETPVTTPVAVSILQTELGEADNSTAPPEGAVAVRTKLPSIGKSLITDGEITGSFDDRAEVASTLCGGVANVLSPSPTLLVAETLTV